MPLILVLCLTVHACYIGSKVVLVLAAVELGASQATVGMLAALYGIAPLVLGVHSGRLYDTAGTRPPLLLGGSLVMGSLLIGAFFSSLVALAIVATLMGMGFVYYNVAIQNMAGTHGAPEDRARNFSWLSMAYAASGFVGPVLAGFVIDHYGHAAAFLCLALLASPPIWVLTFNRRYGAQRPEAKEKGPRRMLDLLSNPPLRRVVIMSGLMVAAWELYIFYLPVHGHAIGLSAATIGIVLGVFAVANLLIRFALAALLSRMTVETLTSASMLIAALGFVSIPAIASAWLLGAVSFAIGLVLGICQPVCMMLGFERSPPGRTGEVTGLRLTANNIARIIVPVIGGAMGSAFGAAPVFWMNAMNLVGISWIAKR